MVAQGLIVPHQGFHVLFAEIREHPPPARDSRGKGRGRGGGTAAAGNFEGSWVLERSYVRDWVLGFQAAVEDATV
jgi:hypothetical protein